MPKKGEVRQYAGMTLMQAHFDRVWDIYRGKKWVGKAPTLAKAMDKADSLNTAAKFS